MNISAEYLPIIVSVAVFLSLLLIIAGIVMYVRTHAKKQTLLGKIKLDAGGTAAMPSEVAATQTRGGIQNRVLNFLGNIGERAKPFDKLIDYTKMRPVFLKAGIRRENARAVYWGAKLLLAVIPALLVFLYRVLLPGPPMSTAKLVAVLAVLAILGYYLPDLWLPSMVIFMVKWAIATIPAIIILTVVGSITWGILMALFGSFQHRMMF